MLNTSLQNQNKYLPQADYIRAIASVAVAIFHLGGKALPVFKFGWLGVEMFFVLSGFIICWSIPVNYTLINSSVFITKRIVRISPPYIISIMLLVILNLLANGNYNPDWSNVLLHAVYLNTFFNTPTLNSVYWTLAFEFQFYLFVALFFPVLIKQYGKWLVLALGAFPLLVNLPQTFLNFSPLFGLGIVTFLFYKRYITKLEFIISGVLLTGLAVYLLGWLPALAGASAVIFIILPLKKHKVIHFLSQISFSLYLTHDIVGSRLVVYLGTQFPKTNLYKGTFFLTGIIVSILFAWLYYIVIEKPFYRYSKSIKYQSAKTQPIVTS